MRRVIDILGLAMALGVLVWTANHFSFIPSGPRPSADAARESVRQFEREILLRATLRHGEQVGRGYPSTIDPAWFVQRPINPLLSEGHPWVEIASEAQADLVHPPKIVADKSAIASFWYNPFNGVVRARVPALETDDQVLKLYNQINNSDLGSGLAVVDETP